MSRLAMLSSGTRRQATYAGLSSMVLRALVLLGKFAFIVVLAKSTSPATLGIYTLLLTVNSIAIYAIGLEIHTFTGREVVSNADEDRSRHIQSHLLTLLGIYALALPVIFICIVWLNIAGKFVFAGFAVIVLLETIVQEFGRYLLMLSRPVASNFLQFLRGAAWMPFPTVAMMQGYGAGIVDLILWSWIGGLIAACLFGLWCLRRYFSRYSPFRLTWLREAFLSSRYYFGVAIITQIQYYSDRFIVQFYLGETQVGVLAFYQNFANTMVAFVQTGVISVMLPQLLLAAKRDDLPAEQRIRRSIFLWAMILALSIAMALGVGMPFLLQKMNRSSYATVLPIFYVLLVGNVILIASLVVHLSLYARRCDALLLRVSLIVIPLGVVTNIVMVPYLGIRGVVWVFTGTALLDFCVKYWLLRRLDANLVGSET